MPESSVAPPEPARGLGRRLFDPVDIASLVAARVVFGAVLLWQLVDWIRFGWVERIYVDPGFHLTYLGFGWVQPLPGSGMAWLFGVLVVAAVGILLGALYRLSCAVFFVGYTYAFLLEQTQYNNHYWLICLLAFLFVWLPAHRSWSVDAWLRPSLRADVVPIWPLWVVRGQMAVVYVFGAVAKLQGDWLLRGEPFGEWLRVFFEEGGWATPGGWASSTSFGVGASWAGFLFDLLIVPALLWRPTQRVALYAAVFFHFLNSIVFDIGIFPMMALGLTLTFLHPSWPRRVLGWKAARGPAPPPPSAALRRRVTWAFGLWFAVQCIVPVRHVLYSGNVLWTEEGHAFSWRMKIHRKDAEVSFFHDPGDGATPTLLEWRTLLTEDQYPTVAMQPDQILQCAREFSRRLRAEGHEDATVRVLARCGLNGRSPQLIVNPLTALSDQPRTWGSAGWITPLSKR